MRNLMDSIKSFIHDEEGVTAIEYALLAALIALAIVVGAGALGKGLSDFFADIATWLGTKAPTP